jgi:hypothetical protein
MRRNKKISDAIAKNGDSVYLFGKRKEFLNQVNI